MEDNAVRNYSFFFKGTNGSAVFLIHGITGTPSEMRHLGKGLNKAGFSVFCNTLPRHCSTLAELKKVTWQEIVDACERDFKALCKEHAKVYITGLSMGALVAIHLAYKFPSEVTGIGALAPTIYYDGWAVPKKKIFINLAWHIPFLRNTINIRESWPYGLKDESLRESIERFYKDADANKYSLKVLLFGSPFFPLVNLYQHHLLTKIVKREIGKVKTPILIMHAKEDDMTSLRNARYILEKIGSPDKSLVILENSYHMITIDNDKDKVIQELAGFFSKT